MSRSLSGIAAGLALGLFSVALTLVIAEWFLRATILPVESVDPFAQVALVADPVIGYRLQQNQRTIMTTGSTPRTRAEAAPLRRSGFAYELRGFFAGGSFALARSC